MLYDLVGRGFIEYKTSIILHQDCIHVVFIHTEYPVSLHIKVDMVEGIITLTLEDNDGEEIATWDAKRFNINTFMNIVENYNYNKEDK
jgi:hypothetical protein